MFKHNILKPTMHVKSSIKTEQTSTSFQKPRTFKRLSKPATFKRFSKPARSNFKHRHISSIPKRPLPTKTILPRSVELRITHPTLWQKQTKKKLRSFYTISVQQLRKGVTSYCYGEIETVEKMNNQS